MILGKIKLSVKTEEEYDKLNNKDRKKAYFNLIDQLNKLSSSEKPQKNSRNSSLSPYTDLTRKHNTSENNKMGGPPNGHPGTSRKTEKNPDHILFIHIEEDPLTGETVQSNSDSYQSHQIIELEPAKIVVIEVRKQTTTVNGRTVVAPNPEGIGDYDRIGPNLKSHVAYMRFELNIPWKRIRRWLEETAGDSIGQGTLASIFKELKGKTKKDYKDIVDDIRNSSIVGADETGMHLNGKKWWIHTFRTEETTLYVANKSRSHSIAAHVLGEDFEGILLTDFWGAYNAKFYSDNTDFAKCMAHALRHLAYAVECEELYNKKKETDIHYAKTLLNVILDAIYLKKFFHFGTKEYSEERKNIQARFDELLEDNIDTCTNEGQKAYNLFRKYKDHILKFLYLVRF